MQYLHKIHSVDVPNGLYMQELKAVNAIWWKNLSQ